MFIRSSELALGRKVAGLDHQGVAFPPASRITVPLADRRRQMGTGVDRDDAGIVCHLAEDHDMVGRLEDVLVAVVARAQLRNAEVGAAMAEREALRSVAKITWFENWRIQAVDTRRKCLST